MAAPAPPTVGHTIVLPLLLTAGFHWFHDIPVVLAHDGHTSALWRPQSQRSSHRQSSSTWDPRSTSAMLASAGSARPEIVQRFDALAQALPGRRVDVALTPGPWPTTPARRRRSFPVLAADGVFGDRVRPLRHRWAPRSPRSSATPRSSPDAGRPRPAYRGGAESAGLTPHDPAVAGTPHAQIDSKSLETARQ